MPPLTELRCDVGVARCEGGREGGRDEDGGAGMAIVSPIADSAGGGVVTAPQKLQKRLATGISVEQDGHLVIAWP
jgi:hypothetical protein